MYFFYCLQKCEYNVDYSTREYWMLFVFLKFWRVIYIYQLIIELFHGLYWKLIICLVWQKKGDLIIMFQFQNYLDALSICWFFSSQSTVSESATAKPRPKVKWKLNSTSILEFNMLAGLFVWRYAPKVDENH